MMLRVTRNQWVHNLQVFAAVLCATVISGCASTHYPVNPALEKIDAGVGYRGQRFFELDKTDNFFFSISFSGGGTRAAALGYGVLEALRDTPITWAGKSQRLIDQIDLMSGVSGGSMLAVAFALDGVAGMPRFEQNFLHAPLQSELVSAMVSPQTLWRLTSPRFGRSEVLAELLDEKLYRGATFADLSVNRKKPFVVVSASDMATGGRFEFNQDTFDYLCADLDGVPLRVPSLHLARCHWY
jgi:NTE family protein